MVKQTQTICRIVAISIVTNVDLRQTEVLHHFLDLNTFFQCVGVSEYLTVFYK